MLTLEKVNSMSMKNRLKAWSEKMEERVLLGLMIEYMEKNKHEYSPEEFEGVMESLKQVEDDSKLLLGGL